MKIISDIYAMLFNSAEYLLTAGFNAQFDHLTNIPQWKGKSLSRTCIKVPEPTTVYTTGYMTQ